MSTVKELSKTINKGPNTKTLRCRYEHYNKYSHLQRLILAKFRRKKIKRCFINIYPPEAPCYCWGFSCDSHDLKEGKTVTQTVYSWS